MKSGRFSNLLIVLALVLSTLSVPAAAVAAPASLSTESTAPTSQGNVSGKIDPLVLDELTETGEADLFVVFKDTADLSPAYSMSWHDRGYFVVDTLKAAAERSQANVRSWLADQNIRYTIFWINNSLFVHADRAAIEALAAFPEVAELKGNHVAHIFDTEPAGVSRAASEIQAPAYPWNITFPMADQVHSQFGIKGQGVVIGGMDTGVEYTHMGLVKNYRGCLNPPACTVFDHTYSWYDPSSACGGTPCDTDGHGTATMGIMAGDDDPALPSGAWIGMAPDAQWIHCHGCPYGSCPDYETTACAQWFLAPGGDPDLRPQVVNHSWGLWSPNDCNGNSFQSQLMAYRAADIVPAFAAGNVGDACNSSTSPANNTDPSGNPIAFASGAHGIDGSLDYYSSCGWNACNPTELFPDVASPGLNSCTTGTGNSYNCAFGGTSSASPHTAGCVALVRSANPALAVADVEQVIRDAANDVDDTSCGGTVDWNNRFGEGYLDCLEAVQLAGVGATGTLNGTVTDASTTLPIADASIQATLTPTRTWHTLTDDQGYYEMQVMTGTLTLEAWKYGYAPEVRSTTVISGMTTTENVALTPAVFYTVDGTVTDAETGWPLYARIDIDGYPGSPVWTDPETGYYSVGLAEGYAYTFNVDAWVPGYLPGMAVVGPLTADTTVNFALAVDQGACIAPGYELSLTPFFVDYFEAGYGNWTMDGLWNPESQTDACGSLVAPFPSPTNATYYGVDGVCTYNNGSANSGSLTLSAPLALPANQAAFLSFASFEATECGGDCGYDNRYVEISTDGGSSWILLGEAGSEGAWYTPSFDLSAYAGSSVQLRFRFDTGDGVANDFLGWMVDDVAIQAGMCEPQPGGLVVGNTYDLNTGLPLADVTVANDAGYSTVSVSTPDDPAVDDSFYTVFSPPGSHLFTASRSQYGSTSLPVLVTDGDTVVQDFYLGTGQLVADPTSIGVTLDMGVIQTEPLTLTNIGTADTSFEISEVDRGFEPARMSGHGEWLYRAEAGVEIAANGAGRRPAYPKAYRWQPDTPTAALNILVYADDFVHLAPNTFLDQALQALGLGYTAHYDSDWAGFEADLTGGTWDLVLIGNDNYGPPESVFTALNNYVAAGGKLVFHGWTVGSYASHPLWSTLGFTFVSNDTEPPDPVYWWDPGHPIFTNPQAVPELTSLTGGIYGTYGQYVEPLAGAEAIAGYTTPGPDPNQAAMVLANDSRTLFKGFLDGQNSADLDADSLLDGVELWINVIDGMQSGFGGDVPWVSEDPISGTVVANGGQVLVDVTFDASSVIQPGDYLATLSIQNDTPYGALGVPVTMTVVAPATYGKLMGTVTGLGYCDADPAPLEGADLLVEASSGATWTLTTDEAGYYQIWLDQSHSPLVVTVTADGHESGQATGVSVTGQETTTLNFDLRWLQPCLTAVPDSLSTVLDMGETDTQQITLANTGAAAAAFEVREQDRGYSPALLGAVAPYVPPPASDAKPRSLLDEGQADAHGEAAPVGVQADLLLDQPPNGDNGLFSDTGCDLCGTGQQSIAENFYLAEGGMIGQVIFWTGYYPADVPIDPDQITVIFHEDAGGYPGAVLYTETGVAYEREQTGVILFGVHEWVHTLTLAASVVLDPGNYWVEIYNETGLGTDDFFWETGDQDPVAGLAGSVWATEVPGQSWNYDSATNLSIQLVEGSADVIWLSEAPISGTLSADVGQAVVDVTFDSGVVVEPGEYWATLNVRSNDPVNGSIGVPVTMTVIAPPDWGKLEGTVIDTGYCDAENNPLAADLVIVADDGTVYNVSTDPYTSYYYRWLEAGTYTVTAGATDHLSATEVVQIQGGVTTTLNMALRYIESCMDVAPESFSVTLWPDTTSTETLSILNNGAGELLWEIRETTATLAVRNTLQPVVDTGKRIVVIGDLDFATDPRAAHVSSPSGPPARPLDAVVLTHSLDQGIVSGNSVACNNGVSHTDNSYLRRFNLADFGITTDLDVLSVQIGIEVTYSGSGSQPAEMRLYVWDPATPFVWANLTLIGSASTTIPDQSLTIIDVPVEGTVPAGSTLVVEFFTPNGSADSNLLFVGSNNLGQTDYTFLAAADCGVLEPTDTGSIGYPDMHLVMNVIGETGKLWVDVPWVSEVPTTGVTLPYDAFDVDVVFDSTGLTVGECYTASLGILHDDPGVESPYGVPLELCVVEQPVPVFALAKEASPATARPGDEVTFTITFNNTGDPVDGATVTDVLPDGVVFVEASDGGVYDDAAGTVVWDDLTVGSEVTALTVVVEIGAETAPGPLTNLVWLDWEEEHEEASATFEVLAPRFYYYLPLIAKHYSVP